jgi:hypothetical protein
MSTLQINTIRPYLGDTIIVEGILSSSVIDNIETTIEEIKRIDPLGIIKGTPFYFAFDKKGKCYVFPKPSGNIEDWHE